MNRLLVLLTTLVLTASLTLAQGGNVVISRVPNPPSAEDLKTMPGDLRAIAVPTPPNLDEFVQDRAMLLALGKALFWDMQVGSDGVQACASCHFRAGADPRSKNQVSPGLKRVPIPDLKYTTGTGPNHQLTADDFPLTRLAVADSRGALDSATDSDDVVSSQGVHHLVDADDPLGFRVGAWNTRRVEPRNTPSVINAVFNHR
jgi:cytochrome c peroxidase